MVFSPIFLHLSVFLLFTIIKILRFYFHSIYICPTCISVDCYSANAFFCFFVFIPYLILFLYHLVCFSLRLFSVYTTLFWPLKIFLQFYKNRALLNSLEKTKIFLISFPWILQLGGFFFFFASLFEILWTVCSPPGFSIHAISQARILEWVAISVSRGSSPPRDQTHVSPFDRQVLYQWATWEALNSETGYFY